jgi:hypothetical protein
MVQSELVPQRISAPKPGAGRPDLSGSRETIPDLATWLQCFAVYMATVTAKEPDLTHNLLTYMVTIAKASMKYSWPSWVVYDQELPPGSGRQWPQGLGEGRSEHLQAVFYKRGNQRSKVVQKLPIN